MLFSAISDTNPKDSKDSFMAHLGELWKKTNRPVAFGLLALITISKYITMPSLQYAATSALGFIILDRLFKLVDLSTQSTRRLSFQNIADAKETILQYIKEAYDRDGYVKIQWLGMTMFNVWGILTFALNELAAEGVIRDLAVEIVMLSPEWLRSNAVNPCWSPDRTSTTAANITAYFNEKRANFHSLNWKQEISFYSHMPGIHGGLINGKYLFMGVCQWTIPGVLHAGECPYYLYTFKDVEDLKKIKIFKGWFEYCAGLKSRLAKAS